MGTPVKGEICLIWRLSEWKKEVYSEKQIFTLTTKRWIRYLLEKNILKQRKEHLQCQEGVTWEWPIRIICRLLWLGCKPKSVLGAGCERPLNHAVKSLIILARKRHWWASIAPFSTAVLVWAWRMDWDRKSPEKSSAAISAVTWRVRRRLYGKNVEVRTAKRSRLYHILK
jgi:hypothetical protein